MDCELSTSGLKATSSEGGYKLKLDKLSHTPSPTVTTPPREDREESKDKNFSTPSGKPATPQLGELVQSNKIINTGDFKVAPTE